LNPKRLEYVTRELSALSSAAFDATDFERPERFFDELPTPINHLMANTAVTGATYDIDGGQQLVEV
jgi:hypothetical protein